jgi:tetratricopeptide (TPR) repeat protein
MRLKQVSPRYAGAHWLEATVYMGRQAFPLAIDTLRAGCALYDTQRGDAGPFQPVGLHLMLGNAHAAEGRDDEALTHYRRELDAMDPGHLYARECCANSWYSIGAVHWRNGRDEDAVAALREARVFVPGHPLAAMLLAKLLNDAPPDPSSLAMYAVDPVLVAAVRLAVHGQHDQAAACAVDLLADAPPGPDGWLLPAEPLIHATARSDVWTHALQILHDRAN